MNSSETVLEEIESESEISPLPIIGRDKGALLERLVRTIKPKRILEVGSLVGFSAILMARNLKKGKIKSIELSKENFKETKLNVDRAGFSDMVQVVNGNALKVIPKLKEKFDLVFLDAKKTDYVKYLKLLEKKNLNKNAIIVADNVKKFAPEVELYLNHVRTSGKYASLYYDFDSDGVEVSIKIK